MPLSLTEGKISALLIRFSLPFLLASIIQMGYGAVDVVIVSWFTSPTTLAGAGNGSVLTMSLAGIFFGFSSGGMILLGQYYGAKQTGNTAKTVGNIILLQFTVALIGTTLVLVFGRLLIRITNVPADVDEAGLSAAGEAWSYMRVCASGLIFQAGFNTIGSMLRALGNSKTPLVFISISCAVNICLDLLFVGVFGMGASGAALATVMAQAVSFLIALVYILRKKLPFEFSSRDIRPDAGILKTILRLGIPISLQTMLNTLSFVVIGAIINKMGLFASSANGIVNNIINVFMVVPLALGSALSAISAQNLGAGKTDRALKSAKLGILFSLVIAVPSTIFANLKPETICAIMTPNPDVLKASAEFLIPFSWDFVLVGFVFCINGLFNGCGITTFVAIHETVAAFAVRIPASWALTFIPNATLFHVGIGTPAATLVSLIMCLVYYRVKLSGGKLAQLKIAGTT